MEARPIKIRSLYENGSTNGNPDNHSIAIVAGYLYEHRHPRGGVRTVIVGELAMPDLDLIKQGEQGYSFGVFAT